MNILELLKNEINILKIDNKYKIARYLYIRTGEIFNYDPIYVFSSEEIRELLKKKKINMDLCQVFRHIFSNKFIAFTFIPISF